MGFGDMFNNLGVGEDNNLWTIIIIIILFWIFGGGNGFGFGPGFGPGFGVGAYGMNPCCDPYRGSRSHKHDPDPCCCPPYGGVYAGGLGGFGNDWIWILLLIILFLVISDNDGVDNSI